MKDTELMLKIYDEAITSEDIHKLFENILNRKIPKDTKIILEVVD